MSDPSVPRSAMVVIAHPDDAEFTVAGTIALWARAGCHVAYVVCTDGNAGSHEPGMTRERLAEIRRAEQREACQVLGVQQVFFLGYDDGLLQPTLDLRRDIVRAIRAFRPDVLLCADPTMLFFGDDYINHPDHRAAAQAAIDAAAPACAMPLLWPEAGPPHRIQQIYVHGNPHPNRWVDISATIEFKIAALRRHASQMGGWDPGEMIKSWNAETGREKGLAYAESFRVITLEHPADAE